MIVSHNTITFLLDVFEGAEVIILDMNTMYKPYVASEWDDHTTVKRILLLEDNTDGKKFLAINPQGSHFDGKGDQSRFKYAGQYWDNVTSYTITAGFPTK